MAIGFQVTIDCADPAAMAAFWDEMLGYVEPPPPEGHRSWQSWLESSGIPQEDWNSANARIDPERTGPRLYFQRVPEPKTVKNRVHLDVNVGAGVSVEERPAKVNAEVERAIALGARKLQSVSERGEYWVVMQDPQGNEFCLQ